MKKFYAVIGNPPYQDQAVGDQKTFQKPIYNDFMDEAFMVSDLVELVHPARFLFNAGSTPKSWNRKMLSDEHLKVLHYETDSKAVFPNQEIKGGIAVTLHDANKKIGPIEVYAPYPELNSILCKVREADDFRSFSDIVITRTAYRFTDLMHRDYPEAIKQLSEGHPYDISTNIFDRLPQVFSQAKPEDGHEYIRLLGRENNSRAYKFIRKDYVGQVANINSFKLFMSSANGSGKFGEALTGPVLGKPGEGSTETFIGIGIFSIETEALNVARYISTKFVRAMLGISKSTQHLTPDTWRFVPLQDFTPKSAIDWSKSMAEIDQQLYKKYELNEAEIAFTESHVKEMQ